MHVIGSVVDPVARAVVTGRDADRDAHYRGRLECLVERGHRLLRPR